MVWHWLNINTLKDLKYAGTVVSDKNLETSGVFIDYIYHKHTNGAFHNSIQVSDAFHIW